MDLLICHHCGLVLRSKAKFCTGCGVLATVHSPTMLAAVGSGSQPLSVTLRPDPLVLERAVLNNQLKEMVTNGNGHVAEDDTEEEKDLDFAPDQNKQTGSNGGSRLSSALGSNSSTPGKDSGAQLLSMLESQAPELSIEPVAPEEPPQIEVPEPQPVAETVSVPEAAAPQVPISPVSVAEQTPPAATNTIPNQTHPWEQVRQPISSLLRSGFLDSVSDQDDTPASDSEPVATAGAPQESSVISEPLATEADKAQDSFAPDTLREAPIHVTPAIAADTAAPPASASAPGPAPGAAPSPVPAPASLSTQADAPTPAAAPTTSITPATSITPSESFFPTISQSSASPSLEQPLETKADPLPELLASQVAVKPKAASSSNDFFAATIASPSPSEAAVQDSSTSSQAEKPQESHSSDGGLFSTPSGQSSLFDFNAPGALGNSSSSDSGSSGGFMDSFPPEAPGKSSSAGAPKFNHGPTVESSMKDSEPDSEDSDQDDESQEQSRSPRRRKTTTSRKNSASRKTTTGTKSRASSTSDDDEDDDEDLDLPSKKGLAARRKGKHDEDQEKSPLGAILSDLDEDMEILGRKIPKKNVLLSGLVLAVIGFMCIGPIFGALGGLFTSVTSQQKVTQVPNLTGEWQYSFAYQKKTYTGKMWLLQKGPEVTGEGADAGGPFQIAGSYNPPKIVLAKQYMENGVPSKNKPVQLEGDVGYFQDGRSHIRGIYTFLKTEGHFTNRRVIKIQNQWEAYMLRLLDPDKLPTQTATGQAPGISPGISSDIPGVHKVQKTNQFFLMLAGGVILVGIILAVLSLKLFGPSGVLNILAKKEYIPSQFKSQHFKMVKELGRPARPGSLLLGERIDWNFMQFDKPKNITLPPAVRDANPHVLVVGSGDKGKTRLLANMICHDIKCGDRAVVVIDSDGGLTDLVVNWIAANPKGKDIAERVIIVDPTNKDGCSAYNPLEAPDSGDLQSAASAVVYGFKAIYTEPPGSQSQWNQQTANILRNAALLLMANGKTLTDLPTLLNENDFRDILLEKIERQKGSRAEYITLLEAWGQYKRLARTDQWITWVEPILNRVSPMLSDSRIRPILTKAKGDLNLAKIIEESRVLLVKIPQGQLDQNGNLLGSLIVTGLKQAAMNLSSARKRHPTALYLDEFDNFIEKETLDAISSETKKFQIGLVGCVKTLQHLPEDFRNTIIGVVGTMCVFAVAKKDGDMLGPQMFRVDGRKIKHRTMQNIFNQVNTSPQFELISDEEKLNIDRVVGQEDRTFFCYRVGTVAGVFHLRSPDFADIPEKTLDFALIDDMYANSQAEDED